MSVEPSLRIAVAVHAFPALTETFILEPIVHLLERGHEVDILALYRGRSGAAHPAVHEHALEDRATCLIDDRPGRGRVRKAWTGARRLMAPSGWALPWGRVLADVTARPVARIGPELVLAALGAAANGARRPLAYDVVHAHMGRVALAMQYLRDWGLLEGPLLATFHGSDVLVEPKRHPPGVYDRLFAGAAQLTANTRFLRDELVAIGAPSSRTVQVPVGVDVGELPFRPRTADAGERVRLLTVASLVAVKGVEYGVRAVGELARQGLDVEYTIVGEGPLRGDLEALVAKLGLEDRVSFMGGLAWDRVVACYDTHHLFVLPGNVTAEGGREAQGKVLAEAQAAGLPVVATTVGGVPEAVAPEAGRLVAPRDTAALAAAIGELVRRPDRWPEMGRRGRAFVEASFDNEHLIPELVARYRALASGAAGSAGATAEGSDVG